MNQKTKAETDERYIAVQTCNYVSKVYLNRILYFLKQNQKISIESLDRSYDYYNTMDYVSRKVTDEFFSPTKGLCINLSHVDHIDRNMIVFDTGKRLKPAPVTVLKTKAAFLNYLKNNE